MIADAPAARPGGWRQHLPYAACLIAALVLRMTDLGEAPLSSSEAAASWAAWSGVERAGSVPAPLLAAAPASAALAGLQSILFWIAGSGDALARLAPAAAGSAAVLLPWIFAAALGRGESVALAALLALDPLFVGYSRLADGAALAAASAWAALLAAALMAIPQSTVRPPVHALAGPALAVALGAFWVSGPVTWDLLPVTAAVLVLLRHRRAHVAARAGRGLALAAATALVLATGAFLRWDAAPLVSLSLGDWLRRWWTDGGVAPPDVWSAMMRFELAPLVLGAGGLGLALSRARHVEPSSSPLFARPVLLALIAWTCWGLLLAMRPGRTLEAWFAIQLPAFVGACYAAPRLVAFLARRVSAGRVWAAAALGVAALAGLQFAAGAVGVARGHGDGRFQPHADVTEPAVRQLTAHVETLRARKAIRGVDAIAHDVDPVLAWQLRSIDDLRWAAAVPAGGAPRPRLRLRILEQHAAGAGLARYPLRRLDGTRYVVALQ